MGQESSHGTKVLLTPSTFGVGVPDQVLGWFPLGFVKDKHFELSRKHATFVPLLKDRTEQFKFIIVLNISLLALL